MKETNISGRSGHGGPNRTRLGVVMVEAWTTSSRSRPVDERECACPRPQ
ncbi:protein of unassigned function [Methylobacterium oryzae CBMB20]|uniref:Protein of unassigned function n=1 Tax=Methylobacterium oryzae CBMB20 TaxID=693986 RepID=A0A089NTU3_9HYPH|nr:protein of unassigned function [Methylobacterium oryzae CBMB20]